MPPVIAVLGTVLGTLGGGSALAGAGALGSLAATGIGLGKELSGGSSGPSQSTLQQEQLTQEEAAQKQQQQQLQEGFKHFAPDAQAQTGGSLSDNSFAALVSELSGQPGDMNLAKQTIFGDAGSTSPSGGSGLANG